MVEGLTGANVQSIVLFNLVYIYLIVLTRKSVIGLIALIFGTILTFLYIFSGIIILDTFNQFGVGIPTEYDTVALFLFFITMISGGVFSSRISLSPSEERPQYENQTQILLKNSIYYSFVFTIYSLWVYIIFFISIFIAAEGPPGDFDSRLLQQAFVLTEAVIMIVLAKPITVYFKKLHVSGIDWGRRLFTFWSDRSAS